MFTCQKKAIKTKANKDQKERRAKKRNETKQNEARKKTTPTSTPTPTPSLTSTLMWKFRLNWVLQRSLRFKDALPQSHNSKVETEETNM